MSSINELIQQYCPDGVDYLKLGSFAKEEHLKNKNQSVKENYSVTKLGIIKTTDYFGTESKVTSEDTSNYKILKPHWFAYSPSRINVGSINYLREPFEVAISPLNKVFSVNEEIINVKYLLFYFLSSNGMFEILSHRITIEGTGRAKLDFSDFAKVEIPVPPLPIQEAVVKILDNFVEIEEKLETELELRKKQHEYYGNTLFAFKKKNNA